MRKFGIFLLTAYLVVSCSEETVIDEAAFFIQSENPSDTTDRVKELEDLLAQDPQNIALWIEKGRICKERLDFVCAADAGGKSFILDSTNLEARALYAWTLINKPEPPLGDIERAKHHYKYILSVEPNNADIMVELANTYSLTGDFESSFKFLNDALRLNDQLRDAYVLKGSNYRIMGNMELALSSYQTAIQVDPNFFMGNMQTGYLLSDLENHKLALEYYSNAVELKPTSIEARYGVAISLQETGRYAEAQEEYRAILAIDPDFYFGYFNQGFIKQHYTQELDSAVYYYNLTLDVEPESVRAWYNLGETYYSQNRKTDAARAFAKALSINPDYEPALIAKEKLR